MPLKIHCRACGKRAVLTGDGGQDVPVCAACGAPLPAPAAVAAAELQDAATDIPADDADFAVSVPRSSLTSRLLPVTAAVVILTGVLAAAVWFHRPASEPPSEMLTRSVEMETDARALLAGGKLQDARDKFETLKQQLATAPSDDATLHSLADRVNEQEEAVDRQLAAAREHPTPAAPHAAAGVSANTSVPKTSSDPRVEVASIDPAVDGAAGESPTARATTPKPSATAPVRQASSPVVARGPVHPIPQPDGDLTDKQIGDSIQAGVNYLIRQFDPARHELKYQMGEKSAYHGGMDALCVYALMQCGEAIPDPRLSIKGPYMGGLVDVMKSMPNDSGTVTYARGIRATALALFSRKEDRAALKSDVKYLIDSTQAGGYSYAGKAPQSGPKGVPNFLAGFGGGTDNSNSQYGLLGVWAGAEAEVEVPMGYWHAVEKHWTTCQSTNGQWDYNSAGRSVGGGSLSMTCAGIASLFVTHDYIDAPHFAANVGRPPFSPALKKALDWLEEGDHVTNTADSQWWGYTLYGIERVGLASGFKYFGKHDWYRGIARELVKAQKSDGSWARTSSLLENGDLVDTAYCLLVLARGRHPILMNKLRFEGNWANRPRDLANLASYASLQLERPINWQIVPLTQESSDDSGASTTWTNWLDSPVLYLASDQPVTVSDTDAEKLRAFVNAGGLLFTQADGDSPGFSKFASELAHKLFPKYEMSDLPENHPLYSVVFKVNPKPAFKVVTNGARILMLHSPTDMSKYWQARDRKIHKAAFDLGVNLFVYATGKRDLRNRLDSNYIKPVEVSTASLHVRVARLRYAGNWDPEPYAWTRFANVFQRETGYALDVTALDLRDLRPETAPIAALTGTTRYKLTADESAAIKKYVLAGGVLLVDGAGGSGAFVESMRGGLGAAFPTDLPSTLRTTHPLLQAGRPGMEDLTRPRVRPFAVETLGKDVGLPSLVTSGRGHVISSPIDLTCGLLGTGTWGIAGYDPAYAQDFVKNAILWTLDGQKDE